MQGKSVQRGGIAGVYSALEIRCCFLTLQALLIVYEVFLPGRVLFACYMGKRYHLYIIVIQVVESVLPSYRTVTCNSYK